MLEFKVMQSLEPKAERLELLKSFKYTIKKGNIKVLISTNLQLIEPTEYIIIAIKVDRITRNNYDGYWLLNYCEQHDVKIELILEPYDVSTANGEMIFRMNLVFGQRERKEIGARTNKWTSDRVYKILTNSIYIGIFEYSKYKRKPQDILIVKDYCEPIIDKETWDITRINLEKINTLIMKSIFIYLLVL